MKIASHIPPIKTRKDRRVTVHGTPYVFAPTADAHGKTHFVAEVSNEKDAEALLDSGHYYRFSKDMQPQPKLSKPAAGEKGGAGGSDDTKKSTRYPEDVIAQADELLKGTIQDVSKAVANLEITVVQAALDIEKAANPPRAGMVRLLEQTIEMARQAGVLKD